MIVDANVLLFAEDETSPFHRASKEWLTEALNGSVRVGLPWASLVAFLRLRTNPRAYDRPLNAGEAWSRVEDWLNAPAAWVPTPTSRHPEVFGGLVRRYHLTANLIPDAHLAALAIEHGVTVISTDTDFARFSELHWLNPLSG
ncbi:MAG TPA: TA system VapC family ribonuclease toxin [Acidimicrobiia bacterium]|nr:TA system VapC family ribonuclease toxin [Acidimicrobiia bacterium]